MGSVPVYMVLGDRVTSRVDVILKRNGRANAHTVMQPADTARVPSDLQSRVGGAPSYRLYQISMPGSGFATLVAELEALPRARLQVIHEAEGSGYPLPDAPGETATGALRAEQARTSVAVINLLVLDR